MGDGVSRELGRPIQEVLNNDSIDGWQVVLVKSRSRWQYMQKGHQLGFWLFQSTSRFKSPAFHLHQHPCQQVEGRRIKMKSCEMNSKNKWLKEHKYPDINLYSGHAAFFPLRFSFSDTLKELPYYLNVGVCDEGLKFWDPIINFSLSYDLRKSLFPGLFPHIEQDLDHILHSISISRH